MSDKNRKCSTNGRRKSPHQNFKFQNFVKQGFPISPTSLFSRELMIVKPKDSNINSAKQANSCVSIGCTIESPNNGESKRNIPGVNQVGSCNSQLYKSGANKLSNKNIKITLKKGETIANLTHSKNYYGEKIFHSKSPKKSNSKPPLNKNTFKDINYLDFSKLHKSNSKGMIQLYSDRNSICHLRNHSIYQPTLCLFPNKENMPSSRAGISKSDMSNKNPFEAMPQLSTMKEKLINVYRKLKNEVQQSKVTISSMQGQIDQLKQRLSKYEEVE